MNLVEVTGLHKRFNGQTVLHDVGFTIATGKITAIIGPNGAGKSTTIETILGLYQPDAGHIHFWRDDWRTVTGRSAPECALFSWAQRHRKRKDVRRVL